MRTSDDLRLVVLDRDGVINHDSDDYIKSPDEWEPLPGSLEAIALLCESGFTVVVASNQSGVGRGLYTLKTLEQIHEKMQAAVKQAGGDIAGIYVCPHRPDEDCDCRKPRPGLLRKIAESFSCNLTNVPFIGDKHADLIAAESVGARPILVRTGYGAMTENALPDASSVEVFDSLADAAGTLVRER